jgi:hypothetical protein
MFCPQCGANNADTATSCVQCGKTLQPVAQVVSQSAVQPVANVPNYLVFAILATLLCCLPAGIPAIIYAAQVNGKLQAGDIAGAQQASKNAKLWCWISVGAGLFFVVAYALLIMMRVMSHR